MATRKLLETVEDDLQAKIDTFFDKVTFCFTREGKTLKEDGVRSVCVDHPDLEAAAIKKLYLERLAEIDWDFYTEKWKKLLES